MKAGKILKFLQNVCLDLQWNDMEGTLNTEQRRQYFAKEKKLLRAMCENQDTII